MSFFTKTCAMSRFMVVQSQQVSMFDNQLLERLNACAFRDIDDEHDEGISRGWVTAQDMYCTEFYENNVMLAQDIYVFSLRIDTRRVPSATLKKQVHDACTEDAELATCTNAVMKKERIKAIRANVKDKLLRRYLPVPHVYNVVWNKSEGIVWVSTTSKTVGKTIIHLFNMSFGVLLEEITPRTLFARADPDYINKLDKLNQKSFFGEIALVEASRGGVLASEFFLWLWFRHTALQDRFEGMELDVANNVVCSDHFGSVATRGDDFNNLTDILRAITLGRRIDCICFALKKGDQKFLLTLNTALDLTAIKCPPVMKDKDNPDGEMLEKIWLLRELTLWLDSCFLIFLRLRFSDMWDEIVPSICLDVSKAVADADVQISLKMAERGEFSPPVKRRAGGKNDADA